MEHNFKKNRGDVAIYIALLVMTIMLAGAVVMSGLLARQIRLGRSVIVGERSFYAANSGLEHIFFELNKNNPPKDTDITTSPIDLSYSDGTTAAYQSHGQVLTSGAVCAYSSSQYQNDLGRLRSRGNENCPPE